MSRILNFFNSTPSLFTLSGVLRLGKVGGVGKRGVGRRLIFCLLSLLLPLLSSSS
jgi:hypothetical protein